MTIEETFAKIEETIEKLEQDDIALEDAFAAYSEGMKLLKDCNEQIDKVEKKVLKLASDGNLTEMD